MSTALLTSPSSHDPLFPRPTEMPVTLDNDLHSNLLTSIWIDATYHIAFRARFTWHRHT